MTRTFWLSFAGQEGHRGVCVVDVDDEDAAAAKPDLDRRFPKHADGAEWFAAATTKAWQFGCNPGGQIAFHEIDHEDPVPRNRLLVGRELAKWGRTDRVH